MTQQLLLASPGNPVLFAASGLGDILWTPQATAVAHGRLSNCWDRGVGPLPIRHRWMACCRWAATPAANDRWSLYLVTGNSPDSVGMIDAAFSPGDADLSSENELTANALGIGTVLATAVDKLFVASGLVELYSRFVTIAGWNGSATKALTNTAADFYLRLDPLPPALQPPA